MAPSIIRGNIRITTTPNKGGRRGSPIANGAALVVLAAGLLFAGRMLAVEYDVMAEKAASARQAGGLSGFQAAVDSNRPSAELPPRSALFRGIMRAHAAVEEPGKAATLLRLATADMDHALSARPSWGEAEVSAAYLAMLRDGAEAASAREALRRSYAAAPFLRGSAPWRIRYAVSVWGLLDTETQSRVVDETVWLARATSRTYNYARGLVAQTPAAPLVEAKLSSSGD
ncbi:hypothetical protein Sphch_0477 [Sphingobium chlorophenolicum L-1]|uniref:Uncharacterized protein n=1 Tax=Sphingobium chlorophenolicum L-1 TaxID=690566 RepID=F6EX11_SPHCR|nr:hypothetical protein Sphch_0477 [Sphingobium chlorophenolicum L-1]